MPYPAIPDLPALASVAGFLGSTTRVAAAVEALTMDRFLLDRLFTAGPTTVGDALVFDQQVESNLFLDRPVENIRPGAQFPRLDASMGIPTAVLAQLYGGELAMTWDEVEQDRDDLLSTRLTRLGNDVLRKSDNIVLDALGAAPVNSLAVATPWATATGAAIVANLIDAVSLIEDPDLGFVATMAVLRPASVAAAMKNKDFRDALEGTSDPQILRTGNVGTILGLTIYTSTRLPVGTGYVAAARQVGTYAGDRTTRSHRYVEDRSHNNVVQGWRKNAVGVSAPLAATRLTGL